MSDVAEEVPMTLAEDAPQPAPLPDYVLHVDGVAVDFDTRGALPLAVRDWLALESAGLKLEDLRSDNVTLAKTVQFVVYVLKKCVPSVPGTDCDALVMSMELGELSSVYIDIFRRQQRQPINRPT